MIACPSLQPLQQRSRTGLGHDSTSNSIPLISLIISFTYNARIMYLLCILTKSNRDMMTLAIFLNGLSCCVWQERVAQELRWRSVTKEGGIIVVLEGSWSNGFTRATSVRKTRSLQLDRWDVWDSMISLFGVLSPWSRYFFTILKGDCIQHYCLVSGQYQLVSRARHLL